MPETTHLQELSRLFCRVYARLLIPDEPTHREPTTGNRRSLYEHAIAVIQRDAHLSALSLSRVARELAISPRHLQRVFEEVGRTTFRATVDSVRMERAARLLEEDRRGPVPLRSVREVAEMVGYRQPAGFAKAFRRYHGLPPHKMPGR